jgi:hypothetical protein
VFRSLFQVGDRPQPISPAVQELWAHPPVASASTAPATTSPAGGLQPFDLFSDRSGKYSS